MQWKELGIVKAQMQGIEVMVQKREGQPYGRVE